MNTLTVVPARLPATNPDAIEKLRRAEEIILAQPQIEISTHHVLHAGTYSRTIRIPAGVVLTSVLIKIPTVVIVNGDVTVSTGDHAMTLHGYNVLPASAGRKTAYIAHTDTDVTMLFPSKAQTVEDAEHEFTDEAHLLFSRKGDAGDQVVITGE
jgi:hypothetical protein